MKRQAALLGFVAVAVIASAALALPWTRSTGCRNDVRVAASLRNIWSSEQEFQRRARVDLDRDGVGEFAYLSELSGATALPGGIVFLNPPLLSGAYRTARADGTVGRSGYRIRVWLPDSAGDGVHEFGPPPEPPGPQRKRCCDPDAPATPPRPPRAVRDSATDRVAPALAARRWCAYAWPSEHGRTGSTTLFIDQDGVVLWTEDSRSTGDQGPDPGAAFVHGGLRSISGETGDGARAQDGNVWSSRMPR